MGRKAALKPDASAVSDTPRAQVLLPLRQIANNVSDLSNQPGRARGNGVTADAEAHCCANQQHQQRAPSRF